MNIREVGSAIQNKGSSSNPSNSTFSTGHRKTTMCIGVQSTLYIVIFIYVTCKKWKGCFLFQHVAPNMQAFFYVHISIAFTRFVTSRFSMMPRCAEPMKKQKAFGQIERMKVGMRLWWDPTTQLPNTRMRTRQNVLLGNNHCDFLVLLLLCTGI